MGGVQDRGNGGTCRFPFRLLEHRFPGVPKWRDIRDVTSESVRGAGIGHITLLTGGFPCQPFSTAGKRKGKTDDRYLWPEMFRVIQELEPDWVIGENVAGITNMVELGNEPSMDDQTCLSKEDNQIYKLEQLFVLWEIINDLECAGYTVQPFIIPACAVNAPHRRYRIFIVAYRDGCRCKGAHVPVRSQRQDETEGDVMRAGCPAPDTECLRCRPGGDCIRGRSDDHCGQQGKEKIGNGMGSILGAGEDGCNVTDTRSDTAGSISGKGGNRDFCCLKNHGNEMGNDSRNCNCKITANGSGLGCGTERRGLCKSGPGGERGGRPLNNDCETFTNTDNPEAARQRGHGGQVHPVPEPEGPCMGIESSHPPDTDFKGLEGCGGSGTYPGSLFAREEAWQEPWPEVATRLCGMDDGVSSRVDRLTALGNAVVPAQIYPILKAIAEIERMMDEGQAH